MGAQPLLNEPLVEGGYYDEQDMHEQAECLCSEYKDNLMSIHQQQEKRAQELCKYYEKRDQQWQKLITAKNSLQISGESANTHLRGLPSAVLTQLPPRASYFQLTPQTCQGNDTDPMSTGPRSSTSVKKI